MVRVTMTPHSITLASIASRGLQLITSIVALATLGTGFHSNISKGMTARLGSHETNFLLLASFSSMMYAAWFLGCVEIYPMVARPRKIVCRIMDATLAFFLLAAAIAFTCSDYVHHCEMYGKNIRCNNLKASVAATFLTLLPLVASFALTYVANAADNEMECPPTGYVVETTPTSSFSPRPVANAPPTPSSKV